MSSWSGRLFPKGTKQADFLKLYARIFNTVEGNTTFYALPREESVARWREDTPDDFRFCFKFPKAVTHEKLLKDVDDLCASFIERVAPLGAKLGTLVVQLPPRFGIRQLERLGTFLEGLPKSHRYAVELRHPIFFAAGPEEREAAELLRSLNVDSVIMDARGLHATDSPALAEVRERKPNLPIVMRATGPQPIVRCVPHEVWTEGTRFVEPWLDQIPRWVGDGKQPYFFVHAPDDTFAPENAYRFHAMLEKRIDVGALPPWTGKLKDGELAGNDQLGLF
jgi:uncharacterized protein YecE (DUF72 family)